jgi:hypothetical protein
MTQFYVVFKGFDGFQKEESMHFEQDYPPPTFYIRNYEQLSFMPLSINSNEPLPDMLKIKHRCFRQRQQLYALGKNIVYYTEERS